MIERSRKAIVSEDGRSIEVMDAGRWVTIRLPICVWDWAAVQRGEDELAERRKAEGDVQVEADRGEYPRKAALHA
ncbi:MAG: hypothetical protein NTV82_15580 [Candidatus Aminicenantes bacterium]|nr:hypothetical protein [Candidatus Aminicenantes bacterium]